MKRAKKLSIAMALIVFLGRCGLASQAAEKNYTVSTIVEDAESGAQIIRASGNTRYDTAYAVADELKEVLGIHQFDSVVVACGFNFPDALSGSYLASVKDAPILLARDKYADDLRSYLRENLKQGGTIYVLGGAGAVPDSIMDGLWNEYNIKRLDGENRYETNLEVLKEAGIIGEEILISTGKNYADSLSASASGKPILLVGKTLTDAQKEFLTEHPNKQYYIIGGESAVSGSVQTEIEAFVSTKRIAGKNRYETSVLVAEAFFDKPAATTLAYAKNFPDGLCGGPLANAMNAPLILTADGKETEALEYVEKEGVEEGVSFGGSDILSDKVVKYIFGYVGNITKEKYEQAVIYLEEAEKYLRENDLENGIVALEDVYEITKDETITNFIERLRQGGYNTQGIELKLGRVETVDIYGPQGEFYTHYENTYDELGRMICSEGSNDLGSSGRQVWYDKFLYDNVGNHIRTNSANSYDGVKFGTFEHLDNYFDENGYCIREDFYRENGIDPATACINHFDQSGNYIGYDWYYYEMSAYYDTSIPTNQYRYEYDADGKIITRKYWGYKSETPKIYSYIYDEKGRCIENRKLLNDSLNYVLLARFTYDNSRNYIKKEEFSYDGQKMKLSTYEEYTYNETKLYICMNSHHNFSGYEAIAIM